jgi:hypothetical protein
MLKSFFLLSLMMSGFLLADQYPPRPYQLDPRGMQNCWINCPEKGLHQGEYYYGLDME